MPRVGHLERLTGAGGDDSQGFDSQVHASAHLGPLGRWAGDVLLNGERHEPAAPFMPHGEHDPGITQVRPLVQFDPAQPRQHRVGKLAANRPRREPDRQPGLPP